MPPKKDSSETTAIDSAKDDGDVIDLGGSILAVIAEPVRFGGRRYKPGARLKVDETTFNMLDEAGVIED